MSGGGTPEVEIARLEQRADTTDREIAELKTDRDRDNNEHKNEIGKLRDELGIVRRSLAWIMGATAIVGAILSQLAGVMADKLK